jgi:hypothetical protein
LVSKDRKQDWDPRAIKLVIETLKAHQKKKRRERRARPDDATGKQRARDLKRGVENARAAEHQREVKKTVGSEVPSSAAQLEAPPAAPGPSGLLVTKDDTLRRQMSTNLSRARNRR